MTKYWWIKERDDPQLGAYYTACGYLTVEEANRNLNPAYGSNTMLKYRTKKEYEAAIKKLVALGR